MTFEEMVSFLDGLEDFEGLEDLKTSLNDYHTEQETVSNGANAKIAELEEKLADAETRYKETAAKNYELMVAAADKPAENDEAEAEEDEAEEDFSDIIVEED